MKNQESPPAFTIAPPVDWASMYVSYGPMDRVGVAGRAGQIRGRGAGVEIDLVLLLGDARDGQRHAGVRHLDDRVHAVAVEPLPRHGGADVGLVQVVGRQHLHLHAFAGDAVLLQRLVHGGDRAGTGEILVRAGHVGQAADPQRRRSLRPRASRRQKGKRREGGRRPGGGDQGATGSGSCAIPPWLAETGWPRRVGRRGNGGRPTRAAGCRDDGTVKPPDTREACPCSRRVGSSRSCPRLGRAP